MRSEINESKLSTCPLLSMKFYLNTLFFKLFAVLTCTDIGTYVTHTRKGLLFCQLLKFTLIYWHSIKLEKMANKEKKENEKTHDCLLQSYFDVSLDIDILFPTRHTKNVLNINPKSLGYLVQVSDTKSRTHTSITCHTSEHHTSIRHDSRTRRKTIHNLTILTKIFSGDIMNCIST